MKSLVIAPHPDDELLGCGGTLLKRISEGKTVGWLLMTAIDMANGWTKQEVDRKNDEIERVRMGIGISADHLYKLDFPAAALDQIPISTLVNQISSVFKEFEPEEVFLPHPGDIHSDHKITFQAAVACTKWFRYASVKRVLVYETLSETEYGFNHVDGNFSPNLFVDITSQIDQMISLLSIYQSELSVHPFPRSLDAVKAQALLRGSQRGVQAAEAFQILREFE